MKILVLSPRTRRLNYACFRGAGLAPARAGHLDSYRQTMGERAPLRDVLDALAASGGARAAQVDAFALRVPYGGDDFAGPVVADGATDRLLERLEPHAPVHLPAVRWLLAQARELRPGVPVVLCFDTAFFAGLPERERYYAVDPDLFPDLRRFGYHGLYHETACRVHAAGGRKARSLISLCLEPRPELAAVQDFRPVTVSGGSTPLEGLPGETSCGELDPGIVILLAQQLGWGAERIDAALTHESGLQGIAGRPATVAEVLTSGAADLELACDVLCYRILQGCGAAVAAMGALDGVVCSGRYAAAAGPVLRRRLGEKLADAGLVRRGRLGWSVCTRSRERIIADQAMALCAPRGR